MTDSQKQPANPASEETLLGEVRKGGVAHNQVIASAWVTATPTDISLVTGPAQPQASTQEPAAPAPTPKDN